MNTTTASTCDACAASERAITSSAPLTSTLTVCDLGVACARDVSAKRYASLTYETADAEFKYDGA